MGIFDIGSAPGGAGLSEEERNFMLRQGIMGMGAQMLQAGAPSFDPRSGSMAHALGQGLQGFQQGQQGALPQIQATQQMAQAQAQAEARRKFGEKVSGMYGGPGVVQTPQMPTPGVPPTAVPTDTGVGVGIGAPAMMGGPTPGGVTPSAPQGGLAELVGAGIGSGQIEPGAGLGLLQPKAPKSLNIQDLAMQAAGGDQQAKVALNYLLAQKKAGGVKVSVGAEQGAYQKARGQSWAKKAEDYQTNAELAQNKIADLDRMTQLMEGVQTGAFAETGTQIARYLQRAGMDIDPNLGNKEASIALSNQMALGMRKPGSGVMTDKDFEVYRSAVSGIERTPEGNRKLIEYQRKVAGREIDLANMAAIYEEEQGQLDRGFLKVRKAFVEANPLFGAKKQPLIMR